jgi:hypothetical protein
MVSQTNEVLLYLGQVEQAQTQSDFKSVKIMHSETYGFVTAAEHEKRERIERQDMEQLRLMQENSNSSANMFGGLRTSPAPVPKSLSLSKVNRRV